MIVPGQTNPFANLDKTGVAFDSETHLIHQKYIPPLVCASAASRGGARLLDRGESWETFHRLVLSDTIIIGANIAFDMAVMVRYGRLHYGIDLLPAVFAKYENDQVFDVLIVEALDAIYSNCLLRDPRTFGALKNPSTGKITNRYSLSLVCDLVLSRLDAKVNDIWKLAYVYLEDLPHSEWSFEARQYPIDDAQNTWDVALAQAGITRRGNGTTRPSHNIHAQSEICRAAIALHLGALRAFDIDKPMIDELVERTTRELEAGREIFVRSDDTGLLRGPCKRCPENGDPCLLKSCKRYKANTAAIKRRVALAFGGVLESCGCDGGKAISEKTGNEINCTLCGGSGIDLDAAPSIPRTDGGNISTARDILQDSGDSELLKYAAWGVKKKIVSTYGPALQAGLPIYPNVPLANLRVSCGGVLLLMPREGGVRECLRARPKHVYSSSDYSGIEMGTWAQVCLWITGKSALADAINANKDTHSMLAATMRGIPYDEFMALKKSGDARAKAERQACKPINFTCSGGGGVPTIVKAKRKEDYTTVAPDGTEYPGIRFCVLMGRAEHCGVKKTMDWRERGGAHVPLCHECCEGANVLREAWFKQWPESRPYFAFVNKAVDSGGMLVDFGTGVIRGGVDYCTYANGLYSMLATKGAKDGMFQVQKECHDPQSPLYLSSMIGFIHDELICEHPEDRSHDAAVRVTEIMTREMDKVVPDVTITVEPAIMRRYYKAAESVTHNGKSIADGGLLIPWEPKT